VCYFDTEKILSLILNLSNQVLFYFYLSSEILVNAIYMVFLSFFLRDLIYPKYLDLNETKLQISKIKKYSFLSLMFSVDQHKAPCIHCNRSSLL